MAKSCAADAAHAQTATASQITAQGGDYLLTVKANQSGTQQAIRDYLAAPSPPPPKASIKPWTKPAMASKPGAAGGAPIPPTRRLHQPNYLASLIPNSSLAS